MGFSENLKKIRIENGLSQQELAKKASVSQTAIYQWEKGLRTPKIDAIAKLADALNVPPVKLFMLKEDEKDVIDLNVSGMSKNDIEKYLNVILPEYMKECTKERELYASIDNKKAMSEKMDLLNATGQERALEQVELLTKIPEYRKEDTSHQTSALNAAHERTDIEVTEEMKKHDDDIMNDDSEWN